MTRDDKIQVRDGAGGSHGRGTKPPGNSAGPGSPARRVDFLKLLEGKVEDLRILTGLHHALFGG